MSRNASFAELRFLREISRVELSQLMCACRSHNCNLHSVGVLSPGRFRPIRRRATPSGAAYARALHVVVAQQVLLSGAVTELTVVVVEVENSYYV
ncbi:hypothetical protein J6590_035420 [Homalodisca vitripennis]|nr:hypothetical protein J6590_035420 [Homalodisca vitripennis]